MLHSWLLPCPASACLALVNVVLVLWVCRVAEGAHRPGGPSCMWGRGKGRMGLTRGVQCPGHAQAKAGTQGSRHDPQGSSSSPHSSTQTQGPRTSLGSNGVVQQCGSLGVGTWLPRAPLVHYQAVCQVGDLNALCAFPCRMCGAGPLNVHRCAVLCVRWSVHASHACSTGARTLCMLLRIGLHACMQCMHACMHTGCRAPSMAMCRRERVTHMNHAGTPRASVLP